jgi:hypothetical protein
MTLTYCVSLLASATIGHFKDHYEQTHHLLQLSCQQFVKHIWDRLFPSIANYNSHTYSHTDAIPTKPGPFTRQSRGELTSSRVRQHVRSEIIAERLRINRNYKSVENAAYGLAEMLDTAHEKVYGEAYDCPLSDPFNIVQRLLERGADTPSSYNWMKDPFSSRYSTYRRPHSGRYSFMTDRADEKYEVYGTDNVDEASKVNGVD